MNLSNEEQLRLLDQLHLIESGYLSARDEQARKKQKPWQSKPSRKA